MRRAAALASATTLLALAGAAPLAAAEQLIADLSSREIRITTGFTGAELLLFGTTDARAGDIVIVVRGPGRVEEVRRKHRVAGVWMNGPAVPFKNVPGFYYVASTRPIEDIAKPPLLEQLQIGLPALRLETVRPADPETEDSYREGLVRLKRNRALYDAAAGTITVIGDRLFRTTISFPAGVPTGEYQVKVYLFRDGKPVSASATPLLVLKSGLEAAIFRFAHDHSAYYGIVAILVALVAGWLAGVIFRKA
jgi:uncharacterized protein (TIGR02186 family)